MDVIFMDQNDSLDKVEKVLEDSSLINPEVTFCEKTTYLDFLLSNAKDEDEAQQIKETINEYLDITDDTPQEDEEDEEE